ncbi:hypothetical protein ACTYEO_07025 [Rhodophyticola sp. SM2404]
MSGKWIDGWLGGMPALPEVVFFQPVWEPYNAAAKELVQYVLKRFDLRSLGKTGQKHQTVVASILQAAKSLDAEGYRTIACSRNSNAFTGYSNGVGRISVWQVVDALDGILLQRVEGSGAWTKHTSDYLKMAGMEFTYAQVTHYKFNPDYEIKTKLPQAVFIQAHAKPVAVNKAETRGERYDRKQSDKKTPRLRHTMAQRLFGRDLQILEHEVRQLNAYYLKHPLQLPQQGNKASDLVAATYRVFHDGRLDAGGRFYGVWTGMHETQRLACKIDDEDVVSLDINASQPFLFSMLMGMHLRLPKSTWFDLYAEILGEAYTEETRDKLKIVAMEVIGSGNPSKAAPSDKKKHLFSAGQWEEYRDLLLAHVPALKHLDNDHMNGHGFIAYHEAEILKQTLFTLMKKDIPAYSVHDCILVKALQMAGAMSVYRDTVNTYVKVHCIKHKRVSVMDCYPAMKLTRKGKMSERVMGSQDSL